MKIRKYSKTFAISVIVSFVSAIASYWVFFGDWKFLPFPLAAGLWLAVSQNGSHAHEYISRIIVGSFAYGFWGTIFIFAQIYLVGNLFYQSGVPFYPFYSPKESLVYALVLVFICFLGGLTGITIKGFAGLKQVKSKSN